MPRATTAKSKPIPAWMAEEIAERAELDQARQDWLDEQAAMARAAEPKWASDTIEGASLRNATIRTSGL